jgi:Tol biopolymer transport system component
MTPKRLAVGFIVVALSLLPRAGLGAGVDPSLKWKTITTEHFRVHYHQGEQWTAQQVAQIAEEVYPHITGLYHYEPGIVDFIVKDNEDFANGAAYYYDNKVELWATNLEFGLRGTTEWLRNVVTHEYTHIVSIGAAMKMPRRIPAIYFQAITFEDEKRPDVLTGYPNGIVSYPYVGVIMPPWFAEGVAQYQSPTKQTDCWDTHRDMILRAAILDDKMLTYDEMGYFGHGSLGNEQVYDHGYGLVRYIELTYGPDAIRRITNELSDFNRMSIDGALKKVTGKTGEQLYEGWKVYLEARYEEQLKQVRANPREGWILAGDGNVTISPSFSPDGKRVAFLSNKGSVYARTSLYLIDRDGKNLKKLQPDVTSKPTFSPDGKKIVYARHRRANLYNAMLSDIHVYDLERGKEKRITHKLRASQPSYSPDGQRIVCVLNADGTHRLAVMGTDGENMRVIYEREKGTQFYNPQFSPDGDRILFGIFEGQTRHIAVIDTDGGNFRYLVRSQNDERDARWLADGGAIVFSSDRTGIFDVYELDLATRRYEQLTNVTGGAFSPDLSATDGSLVYAGYNGDGYHVSLIDGRDKPVAELDENAYEERTMGELDDCAELNGWHGVDYGPGPEVEREDEEPGVVSMENAERLDTDTAEPTADTGGTSFQTKDYEWTYSDLQIFPRVVIWDGTPRFGAFIGGSEILDKQFFFAGGSYGTDGRFDAFISFELRHLFPVLYMEFIRMREKTSDYVVLDNDPDFDALNMSEVRYDLWAADLGLRFEFQDPFNPTHNNDFATWFSHGEYRVHIDWAGVRDGVEFPQNAVAWKYYVGNDVYARWRFKSVKRAPDAGINPRGGRAVTLQYMHAWDELFVNGEFEYGLRPDFTKFDFNQYTLDWREYQALPWFRHTLQLRAYASLIDRPVDDFFWVYMGGMDGIRGYTYYSVGGRQGALLNATYRFPIVRDLGKQISWLTFRDIYGGVFFEAGKTWESHFRFNFLKRSVGAELRMLLGSYYSYPTAIQFVAARSLDRSVYFVPQFEQATIHEPQWRYYLQIGFTF